MPGLCVELPWLDAVEVSASRGFLATYMEVRATVQRRLVVDMWWEFNCLEIFK
jgi:hypothetical protein